MEKSPHKLTQQEIDTWKLLAKGIGYKKNAATESHSIDTLKKQNKSIYSGLHVRSRTEAVNRSMIGIYTAQSNSTPAQKKLTSNYIAT